MAISTSTRTLLFGPPGGVDKTQVSTPWGVKTWVHRKLVARFNAACQDAYRLPWDPLRIDSYNPRPIRGSTAWSLHSWALAWDFFATPPGVPPPGGVWTPHNGVPASFADCFEHQGFTWGGTWANRPDVPHIEWNGPPPVGVEPPLARPVPPAPKPPAPEESDMFFVASEEDRYVWFCEAGRASRVLTDKDRNAIATAAGIPSTVAYVSNGMFARLMKHRKRAG